MLYPPEKRGVKSEKSGVYIIRQKNGKYSQNIKNYLKRGDEKAKKENLLRLVPKTI